MTISDYIGFAGVAVMLVAFFLNVTGKLSQESMPYILMNFLGGGVSCFASVLIHYVPFIILEGCWTLVSFWALIQYFRKKS